MPDAINRSSQMQMCTNWQINTTLIQSGWSHAFDVWAALGNAKNGNWSCNYVVALSMWLNQTNVMVIQIRFHNKFLSDLCPFDCISGWEKNGSWDRSPLGAGVAFLPIYCSSNYWQWHQRLADQLQLTCTVHNEKWPGLGIPHGCLKQELLLPSWAYSQLAKCGENEINTTRWLHLLLQVLLMIVSVKRAVGF